MHLGRVCGVGIRDVGDTQEGRGSFVIFVRRILDAALARFSRLLPHAVNYLSRPARNIRETFDKTAAGLINEQRQPWSWLSHR